MDEPAFSVGVEEEYLLIDPETRNLARPPKELFERAEAKLGKRVTREYLSAQIEIGTDVCGSAADVREQLRDLRGEVVRIAEAHDCQLMAASTHPFASWREQERSDKERYHTLKDELQVVAERLMICGMHVHVGIDDDEFRVDAMNQIKYFLPHLLALSTSSPFWEGHDTGLCSYRLSVFDEMPRSGLPSHFTGWSDYSSALETLTRTGVMEDATKIWWDIRPHCKFPTLEMRICDVCTDVEDAVAIAALYACLARMIWRLRQANQSWRHYSTFLINENRWRAQRFGASGSLIDLGRGALQPFPDLLDEIISLVKQDAQALDCEAEMEHCRRIVERGTSAIHQRRTFERTGSLNDVVDDLVRTTRV